MVRAKAAAIAEIAVRVATAAIVTVVRVVMVAAVDSAAAIAIAVRAVKVAAIVARVAMIAARVRRAKKATARTVTKAAIVPRDAKAVRAAATKAAATPNSAHTFAVLSKDGRIGRPFSFMRVAILCALLLSAVSAFAGVPGQYLVFEIDRNDAITLVAAEDVSFATMPSWSDDAAPADPNAFAIELVDIAGNTIHRTTKRVERKLRAEPGHIERESASFVVRVPRGGDRVRITSSRFPNAAQFSVRDVPSKFSALSKRAKVRSESATSPNRLDLLIVGDGYTAEQESRFHGDVEKMANEFFSIEPYKTYRSYMNVNSLFVPSEEEGADHPHCSDPSPDPKEGTFVDTAFDATFCTAEILRLLTVATWKVELAAAAVPDWDMLLVLVNDPLYGGAGGSISVVSRNDHATSVLQHEFGHTFSRLDDEYSSPLPGEPLLCGDTDDAPYRCGPNITDQTSRALIKWSPWIDPSTPLPTPPSFGGIGLFLGGNYSTVGQYRPKNECLMNLGKFFCEICSQEFVRRIYEGWGGVPVDGVSPIESVTPAPGGIRVTPGVPIEFHASLLRSTEDALQIEWLVNGAVVSSGAASFTHVPEGGTTSIELRVTDRTAMVHPQMANGLLTKSRTWTLHSGGLPRRRAAGH